MWCSDVIWEVKGIYKYKCKCWVGHRSFEALEAQLCLQLFWKIWLILTIISFWGAIGADDFGLNDRDPLEVHKRQVSIPTMPESIDKTSYLNA